MKIIRPSFKFETLYRTNILKRLEEAGRTCYKSEDKITEHSASRFIKNVLKRGHESVIEHEKLSCRIICDRGVTHEIVRHRLASYSQESTRYVNYAKTDELVFIDPSYAFGWGKLGKKFTLWYEAMTNAETLYLAMIEAGAKPQEARAVLPNSIKTEIVVTQNLRQWRHWFRLRALGTTGAPHPQMKEIAVPMLQHCRAHLPEIFEDL